MIQTLSARQYGMASEVQLPAGGLALPNSSVSPTSRDQSRRAWAVAALATDSCACRRTSHPPLPPRPWVSNRDSSLGERGSERAERASRRDGGEEEGEEEEEGKGEEEEEREKDDMAFFAHGGKRLVSDMESR